MKKIHILNEENTYFKSIKQYKYVFDIINI